MSISFGLPKGFVKASTALAVAIWVSVFDAIGFIHAMFDNLIV
jgi:hypothetical protein